MTQTLISTERRDMENYPIPPDFVFKYRRSRTVPEAQVLEQEQSMFVGAGVTFPSLKRKTDQELTKVYGIAEENLPEVRKLLDGVTDEEEAMGGQLLRYEKVPYPSKGWPFPPALYAINAAKRNTLNLLRMVANKDMAFTLLGFALTPKKKKVSAISRWLYLYKESMMRFIEPYVLQDEFCTPFTREFRKLLTGFLTSFGVPYFVVDGAAEMVAMDFEYDNAYRWPLMDAFSETTKEKMLEDPVGEIVRLMRIISERDAAGHGGSGGGRAKTFGNVAKALKYAFWLPSVRRAWRNAVEGADFAMLQADKGDKFYMLLDPSYNYLGKTQEERWKMYVDFFGGMDKLPPRLIWRKARPDDVDVAPQKTDDVE